MIHQGPFRTKFATARPTPSLYEVRLRSSEHIEHRVRVKAADKAFAIQQAFLALHELGVKQCGLVECNEVQP